MLCAGVLTVPVELNVGFDTPSFAVPATVQFTRSEALAAMTENQQEVSDVWFAVSAQFFDPTYNGLGEDGWRLKRNEAVEAAAEYGPDDKEEVVKVIQTMLASLGDPYTRFLPREKYEALTAIARGSSNGGIGVQLLFEPRENRVVVMNTVDGGPAKSGGIRRGDVIVEIDGESMEGASAEVVAAKCKGEIGSKMNILVRHQETKSTDLYSLTRSLVKVNPVEASTFESSSVNQKVGLLKVTSFSQETAGQMIDALREVKSMGAEAIVVDLRGNVGGYMPAGVDAAKLFLPARAHIIAEVNRAGSFTGYDADGIGSDTSFPLYLLVDSRTASAAEIFTAALQDNRRALVVGTTKTFGKGRIQNVQSLQDGSAVAVTRAKYLTPSGRDLHGIGITPNKEPKSCTPEDSAATCLVDIV
eukprot:CAMPEP_0194218932 /NCGR_PEP_ID=MMETSP0156-20130528/24855_1 /TAXON_ID=33649 /ORGANISM="Thalassionema nitzschioides, Strain L26-B" /LENGTH=415 /DNA_ID=CAMNT_0038948447 /DNA_START=394 /DNA_END=1641 /DNA_ORIENTATION=+